MSIGTSSKAPIPRGGHRWKKIDPQPGPSTSGPPISHAAVAPIPPSEPQIPSALLRSEPSSKRRRDDGQRRRRHDRGTDTLQRACSDQRLGRPRQPAQQRGQREQSQTDHEHAPAPEEVGRSAAQQKQAGERQSVGADHPLQALAREVELLLDRRQCHIHDCRVEDHHEERTAQERQGPPPPGIGASGVGSDGSQLQVVGCRAHAAPPSCSNELKLLYTTKVCLCKLTR